MDPDILLLGIDGGGSACRARLCTLSGIELGEGKAGPANIRFGVEQSFRSIFEATRQCLRGAHFPASATGRIIACLALAGAGEPHALAAAKAHAHPFRSAIITSDGRAACIGAHNECDGGIVIVGTGTIGWAELKGRSYRVGGWGLPVSDEGSGAWLGCEALRRALWAHDGRIPATALSRRLLQDFQSPHHIVRWCATALPRDFASLAPIVVDHAALGDRIALELMDLAADHVDRIVKRLVTLGAERLSLVGGLAVHIEGRLGQSSRDHLAAPAGDALQGALQLAHRAAQSLAA